MVRLIVTAGGILVDLGWWFEIQIQIQNKLQIQTQVRMVGATDCDGGRYRGACLGCQTGFPPVSKIPFNQPVQNTNTNPSKNTNNNANTSTHSLDSKL